MGKHHTPRPRGYEPGGFRFPQGNWVAADRVPGVLFANDLPAPRVARPEQAIRESRTDVFFDVRRHGVYRRTWDMAARKAAA